MRLVFTPPAPFSHVAAALAHGGGVYARCVSHSAFRVGVWELPSGREWFFKLTTVPRYINFHDIPGRQTKRESSAFATQ
jgi:hypothetical protein